MIDDKRGITGHFKVSEIHYSSLDALKATRFFASRSSFTLALSFNSSTSARAKCAGFFGQLPKPGATIGIARLRVHYKHDQSEY